MELLRGTLYSEGAEESLVQKLDDADISSAFVFLGIGKDPAEAARNVKAKYESRRQV